MVSSQCSAEVCGFVCHHGSTASRTFHPRLRATNTTQPHVLSLTLRTLNSKEFMCAKRLKRLQRENESMLNCDVVNNCREVKSSAVTSFSPPTSSLTIAVSARSVSSEVASFDLLIVVITERTHCKAASPLCFKRRKSYVLKIISRAQKYE